MVAHGERTSPNGQELLAEFVQYGHQKPFEEIVRRYAGMVFNVCVRITKDKHEAEDATQAVFLTLALQAKRGTEIKALGPWLQQVAKRLSLDTRRSKKRRKTREERHHDEQTHRRESILGDALPEADLDELKTVLHEELQKLPAKYRLPLILHYFGGLTRDEMAAELNCKASTLGVRIFRGREMLAGRLSGRGINISAGALAIALGYTIHRAISDGLIASTSYAATALAAGHDGAGLASAHVIGLTRRAGNALVLGKVKVAAMTLLIAGTSLGASVKAMDMIPAIDVREIISNQVQRIVRPLFAPFNNPMRVDAAPVTSSKPQVVADSKPAFVAPYPEPIIPRRISTAAVAQTKAPIPVAAVAPVLTVVTPAAQQPVALRMPWLDVPSNRTDESATATASTAEDHTTNTPTPHQPDVIAASAAGASGGGGGGGGSGGFSDFAGDHRASDFAIARPAPSLPTPLVIAVTNDLIVPPSLGKSTKSSSAKTASTALASTSGMTGASTGTEGATVDGSSSTAATPTDTGSPVSAVQIVQIPATNGSVQESDGAVRGYGIVHRTGTIQMDGKVIADGHGVDRTLDLRSFTAIQKDLVNASAGGCNGWYAVDHGRLSLPLQSGPTANTLTWGDVPGDGKLDLVNSVRLVLDGTTPDSPVSLSLVSPDRQDLPALMGISGAPVGLWQVDPSAGSIDSADLTVRYNDTLVDQLGASESAVSLWTLCAATDVWSPVDPATFSLDTVDHTVTGSAQDFSYIAVAVPPAPGQDVGYLIANPQATLGQVPEPASLVWLALGGGLLGRRKRRCL